MNGGSHANFQLNASENRPACQMLSGPITSTNSTSRQTSTCYNAATIGQQGARRSEKIRKANSSRATRHYPPPSPQSMRAHNEGRALRQREISGAGENLRLTTPGSCVVEVWGGERQLLRHCSPSRSSAQGAFGLGNGVKVGTTKWFFLLSFYERKITDKEPVG